MPQENARRLLCLILPWVQALVAFMPAVGLGTSMAVISAASQNPVTPAGYAFIIWTPIFLLSIAYGIWQFLPANRLSTLARRIGWPLAGAFAADALWQVVSQLTASFGFGLVVIILLGLACALAALFLGRGAVEAGLGARWIARPLTGLLAGWLTAASFANLAAAWRQSGTMPASGFGETLTAMVILFAAGGVAAGVTWMLRRDGLWYVLAVAWALVAIIVANLGANQLNIPAALTAAAMLALSVAVYWQRSRA